MAVKTIWPINHSCGHKADRDLSNRPADRRAGFAEWFTIIECQCFGIRAQRFAQHGAERARSARDKDVLETARKIAFQIIEEDPQLRKPEYSVIKKAFMNSYKDSFYLMEVA